MNEKDIHIINSIRAAIKDKRPGSLPYYIYNNDLFSEELPTLLDLSIKSGKSDILINIVKKYENQLFSNTLKLFKKLKRKKTLSYTAIKSNNPIRYVNYYIINKLVSDSILTEPLLPLRIGNTYTNLIDCIIFFMLLFDNGCTNLDITQEQITAKVTEDMLDIVKYISLNYNTNVLIIKHNKRDLFEHPEYILHETSKANKRYICILQHQYGIESDSNTYYEAILFNNHSTQQLECSLSGDRLRSILPKEEVKDKEVRGKTKAKVKPVIKSKKTIIKKITADSYISIDPLDNGEELPIIEVELGGTKEQYLLGKSNILYSLDTPSSLIGKLIVTDHGNSIGDVILCNS